MIIMSPDVDGEALKANLPDSLPVVLLNTDVHNGKWAALEIDNREEPRDSPVRDVDPRRAVLVAPQLAERLEREQPECRCEGEKQHSLHARR